MNLTKFRQFKLRTRWQLHASHALSACGRDRDCRCASCTNAAAAERQPDQTCAITAVREVFLSAFLGLMASSSLPLGDLYSDEWVPPEHATEEEIKELIADRNYEKHGRYATSRMENVGVVGVF